MSRLIVMLGIPLLLSAQVSYGQVPRLAGTRASIEATGGNSAAQLRYLAPAPWARLATLSDLDYGFLFSESRDIIGSVALMFHADVRPLPRLQLTVGPQGYLALLSANRKTSLFAVAIGAAARYEIIRSLGVAAFGSAFYSPGVLTFGNAHNLYDFTAGGEARLMRRLTLLAGYRWFKITTVDAPDIRVQNELFVGLRWALNK